MLVFAAAGFLASCGGETKTTDANKETAVVDSPVVETPVVAVDSSVVADSTVATDSAATKEGHEGHSH